MPFEIVLPNYHETSLPTIRGLEFICPMDRHVAVDDLVVLDRDKELVLAFRVAAVEIEEVDEDRLRLKLFGMLLDEDGVLRERVVFEEVIQLERALGAEEVENERGGRVPEGKEERDERVPNETVLAVFFGQLRKHDDVHRLIVLRRAAETRGLGQFDRFLFVRVEHGEEHVARHFPGLVRDARDHFDRLELSVGRRVTVDEIAASDEDAAEDLRDETDSIVIVGFLVLLELSGILECLQQRFMLGFVHKKIW